jgi:DNA-binding response OmpR family regulator
MADILIIDDEKAIRKTLTEILSFEGYKLDEAADGEEGLKKFKEKTYDLSSMRYKNAQAGRDRIPAESRRDQS